MWLNDKQVVDNDGCHGERERGSSKTKYTAGAHKLVVDMCEYGGGEVGWVPKSHCPTPGPNAKP